MALVSTRIITGRLRHFVRKEPLARSAWCYVYCQREKSSTSGLWKPDLYVIDKYGTMVNMHTVWTPWVLKMGKRLEASTGLALEDKLLSTLDICTFTKRVRSGVVADGTSWQIKSELEHLLHREGVNWRESQRVVENCWEDCTVSDPATIEQLQGIRSLFVQIKDTGAKIAVCSSDLLASTNDLLDKANLTSLIDHVMCGENYKMNHTDRTSHVTKICSDVGVEPSKTVVIGDTLGDMQMGRAGEVGLTIGVLSGTGTRLDFHGLADFVTDDIFEAVNKVQTLREDELKEVVASRQTDDLPGKDRKADLVIFDKDGTLLCFETLWTPWAEAMIERLEAVTGLKDLGSKVLPELGYFHNEQRWRPAVFTEGTEQQSKDKLAEILKNEGLNEREVGKHIKESWLPGDHSTEDAHLSAIDNPAALFKSLKAAGIKVAVCTSDSRSGTEKFLTDLDADMYVDMIVCGDDPDSIPKPDPNNALMICDKLDVDPARALIVGDTSADMGMGRAAKLGATVAVLSGVGDVSHLAPDADHMVPSISHVLDVVKK